LHLAQVQVSHGFTQIFLDFLSPLPSRMICLSKSRAVGGRGTNGVPLRVRLPPNAGGRGEFLNTLLVNPVIGIKGLMMGCAVIAMAVLVALALCSASAWLVGPFKLIQSTNIKQQIDLRRPTPVNRIDYPLNSFCCFPFADLISRVGENGFRANFLFGSTRMSEQAYRK
jgi:hypothetical protein